MSTEGLLDDARQAMRRLGEPRLRDPKADAEMVAMFIQTLVNEGVQADMIKDLAIAYLVKQ